MSIKAYRKGLLIFSKTNLFLTSQNMHIQPFWEDSFEDSLSWNEVFCAVCNYSYSLWAKSYSIILKSTFEIWEIIRGFVYVFFILFFQIDQM